MWLLEALGRFWACFSTLTRSVLPPVQKMPHLPLVHYWKNPKENRIAICGAAGIPLRRASGFSSGPQMTDESTSRLRPFLIFFLPLL